MYRRSVSWAPRRRTLLVAASTALAVGLTAGTAYGYWRTTGSGSGTASTGTPSGVTVEAVSSGTPASKLIPGGPAAELLVQVSNPNTYPVTLVSIAQNGDASGCSNAATTVTVPTQSSLTITIPAGSGQLIRVPSGISMDLSAANNCQGASLHVPVSITVRK